MKILALTSIRSDYDLLLPLYKLLHSDKNIDFKLLVSGAHLSHEFGYSKNQIIEDGFEILMEIDTLLSSDQLQSKLKTASIFLQNSIDIVSKYAPNLILYAGDREDVIMGGLLGLYLKTPTIHFYGGDHETAGHEDTVIRHATSKLSSLHFVSTEEHANRLLKIGESPNRIFNVGSIALDRFYKFDLMSYQNILECLDIQLDNIEFKHRKKALLIYHPSPNPKEDDAVIFDNILKALDERKIYTFVSLPNTDKNYSKILEVIDKWRNDPNFFFYKNLERRLFLSIFKQSDFIIGNSSAGMLEAASIPIPSINVGSRQKGRMSNKNVLFVGSSEEEIGTAIQKIQTPDFLNSIKTISNIYGDGNSAIRAYKLIKKLDTKSLQEKPEDPLCL